MEEAKFEKEYLMEQNLVELIQDEENQYGAGSATGALISGSVGSKISNTYITIGCIWV